MQTHGGCKQCHGCRLGPQEQATGHQLSVHCLDISAAWLQSVCSQASWLQSNGGRHALLAQNAQTVQKGWQIAQRGWQMIQQGRQMIQQG